MESSTTTPRGAGAHRRRDSVWKIHLTSLAEVRVSQGARIQYIGAAQTIFGSGGERISVKDMTLFFYGDECTHLCMILRLPTGALRITWREDELCIDEKFRITPGDFTVHSRRPPNRGEPPVPYFVEFFGQRSEKMQICHAGNTYMVRSERDFPAVVMPYDQYCSMGLSLLRDFHGNQQSTAENPLYRMGRRRRRGSFPSVLSPRTPLSSPNISSESNERGQSENFTSQDE